jgi:hypothetical protein
MPSSRSVRAWDVSIDRGSPHLRRGYWLGLTLVLSACVAGSEGDLDVDEGASAELARAARPPYRDAGIIIDGGSPLVDTGVPLVDAGVPPPLDAGVRDAGGPTVDGGFPSSFEPVGLWHFDDCSASSTQLLDSSPSGAHATRSSSVSCAQGIAGTSVLFDDRKDTLQASHPAFALNNALTVAAWVNPQLARTGSVVSKQQQGKTAFELVYDRNKVTFHVTVLKARGSQVVSSSIAIPVGSWSHVAGVYDGQFVRLFRDGVQVGQVSAPGGIADVGGPVSIGNNHNGQFFSGRIDEVQLFNRALQEFEIADLSCLRNPATFAVTPLSGPAVDPDVSVHYDITYTNNNGGACQPSFVFLQFNQPPAGFSILTGQSFESVPSGQSTTFTVDVTGSTDADPGTQQIPFTFFSDSPVPLSGQLTFTLNAPSGCFVRTGRELLMRDLSVVEDPVRTTSSAPADPRSGVWTFGRLMEQLAPTPAQAPAMVEQMFSTWLSDQTVNGFSLPSRTQMKQLVLDPWPRTEAGALDLTRAPLRLLAIVNRLDLRDLSKQQAGEGRFVFGILDGQGFAPEFTLILEYRLPATTTADVVDWGNQWHALGELPFPSEQYNAALEALTTRFAGRNADPTRQNGSALNRLRTNEIALFPRWELREFGLSASTGLLVPQPVDLTPDTSFISESSVVADYVNQNEADILIERHTVPLTFAGAPFLGGSSFNDLQAWTSSGIVNPEARFRFSLNTCNGCHSSAETGTAFLHISPRSIGQSAQLSGFMTGVSLPDPVTGVFRTLNDLGRRNADLKAVVCGGTASTLTTPLPTSSVARSAASPQSREAFLSKGIGRVH